MTQQIGIIDLTICETMQTLSWIGFANFSKSKMFSLWTLNPTIRVKISVGPPNAVGSISNNCHGSRRFSRIN